RPRRRRTGRGRRPGPATSSRAERAGRARLRPARYRRAAPPPPRGGGAAPRGGRPGGRRGGGARRGDPGGPRPGGGGPAAPPAGTAGAAPRRVSLYHRGPPPLGARRLRPPSTPATPGRHNREERRDPAPMPARPVPRPPGAGRPRLRYPRRAPPVVA